MAHGEALRTRVIKAVVEDGFSRNEAARIFRVGIVSAIRWVEVFEKSRRTAALPTGGDRRSVLNSHRDWLLGLRRMENDLTLDAIDACYPVVIFDALRVKIRDEGFVRNKAIYLALAIGADGKRDVLGIWVEQNEGAKFWLKVMNELKNRGLNDILIAVVDGLTGFPEAINAVFPKTIVQTCIVHLVRTKSANTLRRSRGLRRSGLGSSSGSIRCTSISSMTGFPRNSTIG
jgi:transposase